MKTILTLLLFCCAFLSAQAQKSVKITYADDSSHNYFCPVTPASWHFYLYAEQSGYAATDSFALEIFYGDGTDTLVKSTGNWFYLGADHTYNGSGTYTVKYRITGPDGLRDSIEKVNHIVVGTKCLQVYGDFAPKANCPTVSTAHSVYVSAHSGGYNSTDSLLLEVFYGDGHDTAIKYLVSTAKYFNWEYTYPSAGTYTVKYRLTAADGSRDSVVDNPITLTASCLTTSGYATKQKPCASVPVEYTFMQSGNTRGYTGTDSLTVEVFFGDGSSSYDKVIAAYYYSHTVKHTYYTGGVYSVKFKVTGPDGNSDSTERLNYLHVHNQCGDVSGKVYLDANNNCTKDAGEIYLSGIYVKLKGSDNSHHGMTTNQNGEFFLSAPVGPTYELSTLSSHFGYSTGCPSSGMYTITSFPANGKDFALQCNNSSHDLWASFVGGTFVPGRTFKYNFVYGNKSCDAQSGQVMLTLDSRVTYISADPTPSSVTGSTLIWDFTDLLNTDQTQIIELQLKTASSATINDTLIFNDSISYYTGDVNATNNSATRKIRVRGSYDPNEKKVLPEGDIPLGKDTELTYTVFFQNTGTWLAYDVYIMDTLDQNLDMETFHVVGSSHPMEYMVHNPRIMKFDFRDIMLPDSFSDEPNSHGFVQYKISTKPGLAEGTEIKNTAHIFFDYNAAIVTNTTINTVVKETTGTSTGQKPERQFKIYPNPAGDRVLVTFEKAGDFQSVSLTDISGRTVLEKPIDTSFFELNTSVLPEGIYIVKLSGKESSAQKKLLILH